jgi:hypothetical protein
MDMKGGRTQREERYTGRKDTKGRRTQREEGHEVREDMKGGNVIDGGLPLYMKATKHLHFVLHLPTAP